MFSLQHFIWLGICISLIVGFSIYLFRIRPPLLKVLSVCCVICVFSELIKTFSAVEMVPSTDGSKMYPYIELQHMPLHLCSIQIASIFYARFGKDSPFKESMLAFMYPSCILGALAALILPSIFSGSVDVKDAFAAPLAYQYFLYHAMLITLGGYIGFSGQVSIKPKHYLTSLAWIGSLAFFSLYFNSMFASPTYINGKLVSVDYIPNFFFTFRTPIGIKLTQLWHWYLYLGILLTLVLGLVALLYIPFFKKKK